MKNLSFILAIAAITLSNPALSQGLTTEESDPSTSNLPTPELTDTIAIGTPDLTTTVAVGAGAPGVKPTLTDEQLEKLAKIKSTFADSTASKRVELQSEKRQLRDLLTQPNLDRAKISGLQSKINALHDELSNLHLAMRMDSFDVLDADQKKIVRERSLKRQLGGGMRKHHHGGGRKQKPGIG